MNGTGTVAVASGGSRGLGQALVARLLEKGQRVATFSRTGTEFTEICRSRYPDHFRWQGLDSTDLPRLHEFVQATADHFGGIDVLINNAGTASGGVLPLVTDDEIHQTLTVNLESAIHLSRACVRSMLQRGGGCIVNIASVLAYSGHAGVSVYSATKAALVGLTHALARELGGRGIRVNAVAPGYFESDMVKDLSPEQRERIVRRTPLGRLGTVEDIAGAVDFLLSPEARFITGHTLVVDGGMTC